MSERARFGVFCVKAFPHPDSTGSRPGTLRTPPSWLPLSCFAPCIRDHVRWPRPGLASNGQRVTQGQGTPIAQPRGVPEAPVLTQNPARLNCLNSPLSTGAPLSWSHVYPEQRQITGGSPALTPEMTSEKCQILQGPGLKAQSDEQGGVAANSSRAHGDAKAGTPTATAGVPARSLAAGHQLSTTPPRCRAVTAVTANQGHSMQVKAATRGDLRQSAFYHGGGF